LGEKRLKRPQTTGGDDRKKKRVRKKRETPSRKNMILKKGDVNLGRGYKGPKAQGEKIRGGKKGTKKEEKKGVPVRRAP